MISAFYLLLLILTICYSQNGKWISNSKCNKCLQNYQNYIHTFNGPFSGTTQVSRYQKRKTNLDFTEATDSA